ncbi:MAG: 8-oxo-dGTP diphosphatase [Lachnospiraceae bacterium]|nr:8-oxo-dGTP diphosphatase [Lachnospiraceae bacterium]
MLNTTLCYIEKDNKYLMLHRVKKVNDLNHDKWVGIGGKFMENETPDECLLREVKEETGLTLTEYRLRGIVTFLSDKWEGEYMYLYTATDYTGEMIECDEGNLEWVPVDKVCDLPIWEGDKLFFNELSNGKSFFTMMLKYEGERLIDHSVKYHG